MIKHQTNLHGGIWYKNLTTSQNSQSYKRQGKTEKPSQTEETKEKTKCNAVSWIGSWNRNLNKIYS